MTSQTPYPQGINEPTDYGAAHLTIPMVDELGPKMIFTGLFGPDGKEITRQEWRYPAGFWRVEPFDEPRP